MANRLFLIGAAKCGTTTLDRMLRFHPEVYMSPIKEPNYYSTDIRPEDFTHHYKAENLHDLEAYFANKPLADLHLDFVRNADQYRALFEGAPADVKYLGESSTSYLYSEVAAENVAVDFPEAKIVVCLRHPVDRMKSHLKMALQGGYIVEVSDELIESDINAPVKGWGVSELFAELGMYGEQLERWYDHFPKESIHVVFFDDLAHSQEKVWEELCAFLNVSIFALDEDVHENSGGVPRFPMLNAVLRSMSGLKSAVNRLPDSWVKFLKSKWSNTSLEIEIDHQKWTDFYREDVRKLEKLLGQSLHKWK